MTITADIDTTHLSIANIDATPVHFDWSENPQWGEDGDPSWEVFEAVERESRNEEVEIACDECDEPIVYDPDSEGWVHVDTNDASCVHEDSDDEPTEATPAYDTDEGDLVAARYHTSWQEGGPEVGLEGPMMNYYYPLDTPHSFDPQQAALKLVDLPVCLVSFANEYALALTGGGMDLSWEICEAYVRLGEAPPFHFASRLPRMAEVASERHVVVLQAAAHTIRSVLRQATYAQDRLRDNAVYLKLDPAEIFVVAPD